MISEDYKLLKRKEKIIIMLGISEYLLDVNEYSHPYTYQQLQNDEAKVNLIKNIINEMFGAQKNKDIKGILDGFESASQSSNIEN
tara:strand:- start:223 stop:477 length:255 start_codon:yes stop_codon:yes gene_type:complete